MKAPGILTTLTAAAALLTWGCTQDDGGGETTDTGRASGRDIGTAGSDAGGTTDLGADLPAPPDTGDTGSADSAAAPDEGPEPVEVGLSIAYDLRFDTRGFFADAAARAVLDEAARQWGLVLRDDFDAIEAGDVVYVRNPENTSREEFITLEQPIDDLLVFPGAAPRSESAAGSSATAGFPSEQDDPELRAALQERWEGDDFEPWTGWIQFNSERSWFFDESPETGDDIPEGATDALSVTLHELGHILGIAPGGAFDRLVVDGYFTGPRAVEVYGGPVPIADGFGHIAEGVTIDGQPPLMATGRIRGVRYGITRLDIAMLADIGYEVLGI